MTHKKLPDNDKRMLLETGIRRMVLDRYDDVNVITIFKRCGNKWITSYREEITNEELVELDILCNDLKNNNFTDDDLTLIKETTGMTIKKETCFYNDDAVVLEEIGNELNVTREAVRQIIKGALKKMRGYLVRRGGTDLLELVYSNKTNDIPEYNAGNGSKLNYQYTQ